MSVQNIHALFCENEWMNNLKTPSIEPSSKVWNDDWGVNTTTFTTTTNQYYHIKNVLLPGYTIKLFFILLVDYTTCGKKDDCCAKNDLKDFFSVV